MRFVFVLLVLGHGLLHLIGFTKAFGFAEMSALTQPISPTLGIAWLLAALLLLGAAITLALSPRLSWPLPFCALGLVGALVSQGVIFTSWSDARWGSLANLLTLALVTWAYVSDGPNSLRAEYRRSTRAAIAGSTPGPVLTEADLAALPPPVRRYLEVSGAIGRPRPNAYRARWSGRIRSAPDKPWMKLEAVQVNTLLPPSRRFWIDASMAGVPIPGLHAYVGGEATMRVRVLGLLPVADAKGPDMTRAETVTLFNDMCLLAPGTLTSSTVRWQELGPTRARGEFENAGHTVRAELVFGDDGMLVDFICDDRGRAVDGKKFESARWSTPMSRSRSYGALRLPSQGEARWHFADGTSFAYVELELLEAEHDPAT